MLSPSIRRRALRVPALALALLLALVSLSSPPSSSSSFLRVHGAASSIRIDGSVNVVFLSLFQQALLAYQLQVPEFTGVTITSHSGLAAGLAAAQSGAFDFVVGSSSAPDSMRTTSPTMESYPIAVAGVAPFYNLPAEVGTDVLTLTNEAMCRMWRGDITHW